jgi:hypothetical protein
MKRPTIDLELLTPSRSWDRRANDEPSLGLRGHGLLNFLREG